MSSSDQSREFRPGRDIGVAGARRAVATASSAIVVGLTAGFQNMVAYWKVASLWFPRRRGLVLSLISMYCGMAYSTLPT